MNFLGCALVCFIEVVRLARGQAKLQVRRRRRIGGDSRLSAGGYDVLVSARIHDQSIHYLGREIARRCAESLESTRQGKMSLDQNVKMRVSQVVWGWTREDGRDESKRGWGELSKTPAEPRFRGRGPTGSRDPSGPQVLGSLAAWQCSRVFSAALLRTYIDLGHRMYGPNGLDKKLPCLRSGRSQLEAARRSSACVSRTIPGRVRMMAFLVGMDGWVTSVIRRPEMRLRCTGFARVLIVRRNPRQVGARSTLMVLLFTPYLLTVSELSQKA